MKQNEKFLVYAVTGFLVVILMVAVVFGSENRRPPPGEPTVAPQAVAPSLEELLNQHVAKDPDGQPADRQVGLDAKPGAVEGNGDAVVGDKPLVANVQLLPPTAASMVTEKLGLSRAERGYRVVKAQKGDTLSSLALRWCGGGDHLEQVHGLNEELTTLRIGQDVVLPWVDDEVLLAAIEERGAKAPPALELDTKTAAVDAATAPRRAAAAVPATSSGRKYVIKAGDSFWRIAEREVGRKGAPKFIEQLRALNPGLDADRLRQGAEIVLPPAPAKN